MGKKSWLSTVKRAFRSTSKKSKGGEEHEQQNKEKKREIQIWPFRKHNNRNTLVEKHEAVNQNSDVTAATAKPTAKMIRLSGSSCNFLRENWAAIMIQTAFRRYLARRAFCALKGLVKFQALVRGNMVRKQAKLTLKRAVAVARIQDRVIEQRARFSVEGTRETRTNYGFKSGPKYLQESLRRRSLTGDEPFSFDKPDEKIVHIAQRREEASSKREEALAYASSNQVWKFKRGPTDGKEAGETLLDGWMSEERTRRPLDRRDEAIDIKSRPRIRQPGSPLLRSVSQPQTASPRCYSAAHTPRLINASTSRYDSTGDVSMPSYMALTESVRARIGSHSSPRQGLSAPEWDSPRCSSAEKRLAYPVDRLRCPSFASLDGGHIFE